MNTLANPASKLMAMTENRRKWVWYRFNGGKMTFRAWMATRELKTRSVK